MNNFEKMEEAITQLMATGIVIREEEVQVYSNLVKSDITMRDGNYVIRAITHYDPETEKTYSTEIDIVCTTSENARIDFTQDGFQCQRKWYNDTRNIVHIIHIKTDCKVGFQLTTFLPLSNGTNARSTLEATLDGDVKYASREILTQYHANDKINCGWDRREKHEKERQKIDESCPRVPIDNVIEAVINLNFDGLVDGLQTTVKK